MGVGYYGRHDGANKSNSHYHNHFFFSGFCLFRKLFKADELIFIVLRARNGKLFTRGIHRVLYRFSRHSIDFGSFF